MTMTAPGRDSRSEREDARAALREAARAAKRARARAPVRVVAKHDGLVRISHWAHVPLLLGLIATGLAIYWAAPVFHHAPAPGNPRGDFLIDAGRALAGVFGGSSDPRNWLYERVSVGPGQLAAALRLHWLFAYF